MDPATILADAQIVIALAKLALQVGEDAGPFILTAYDILFNKKTLTDAERSDMAAKEAALRAQLQDPLPPDETDPT